MNNKDKTEEILAYIEYRTKLLIDSMIFMYGAENVAKNVDAIKEKFAKGFDPYFK